MANPENSKPETVAPSAPPPPPARDLENQKPVAGGDEGGGGDGVSNILQRWKREDLIKRGSFVCRGLGLVFSFLAFIIMASNKHGDGVNFDDYEEYRYVLAIAILSTLYTILQALRHFNELSTGKEIISRQTLARIDFFGDQIAAYLLISAASSAVPLTNRLREVADNIFTDSSTSVPLTNLIPIEGPDNIFTDSSAAAISMEFLAFFSLGLSALVSGYKLSNQTYI